MPRSAMDELERRLTDGLQLDSQPPPVVDIAERAGRRRRRRRVLSGVAGIAVVLLVAAGLSTFVRSPAPPDVVVTSASPQPSVGTVDRVQRPAFSVEYDIRPPDEPWGQPPFRFHPQTRQGSDGKTVMPVVYPNGARAELAYDPQARLADTGLFVHVPGLIYDGRAPALLAQGYWGPMDDVIAWKYGGQPPRQVAAPTDGNGTRAAVWNIPPEQIIHDRRDVTHAQVLSVQLGSWTLLVEDVRTTTTPTDSDVALAELAPLISGGTTPEGFLYLLLQPPLQAADRGHIQQSAWLSFGDRSAGEDSFRTYVGCNASWGHDHDTGRLAPRCDSTRRLAFEVIGSDQFARQVLGSIEARNIHVPPDVYQDRWIDQDLHRLYVERYGTGTPTLTAAFQHIDDHTSMNVVGYYLSPDLPDTMTTEQRLEHTIERLAASAPPAGGGNPLALVAPNRDGPTRTTPDELPGDVNVHLDDRNVVTVSLPDWTVYEVSPAATNGQGGPPPNPRDVTESGRLALEQLAATVRLDLPDTRQIILETNQPIDPGQLIFGIHRPGDPIPNDPN